MENKEFTRPDFIKPYVERPPSIRPAWAKPYTVKEEEEEVSEPVAQMEEEEVSEPAVEEVKQPALAKLEDGYYESDDGKTYRIKDNQMFDAVSGRSLDDIEGFAMNTPKQEQSVIDDKYLEQLALVESSNNPTAKAKTSSATGLHQFIDSTWLDTVERYEPELMEGKTEDEVLDMRTDPEVSTRMAKYFTQYNAEQLTKAGVSVTPGALYLAHFAGVSRAKRVLSADPETKAADVFGKAAVKANKSILGGDKTVGDVIEWANKKMEYKSA